LARRFERNDSRCATIFLTSSQILNKPVGDLSDIDFHFTINDGLPCLFDAGRVDILRIVGEFCVQAGD
jgi:hypothetical protein